MTEFNENLSSPLFRSENPGLDSTNRDRLPSCCKRTIDQLAKCNSMMICTQCRQIIKIFNEENAYRNFLRFCESRNRVVIQGEHGPYFVVTYPTFNLSR